GGGVPRRVVGGAPPGGGVWGGGAAHQGGREDAAGGAARRNIAAFALMAEPVDAILVTASGCGTTLKDYGFMLRSDSDCASEAARVSGLTMDICEYFSQARLIAAAAPNGISVAYHAACSLQHGQKITRQPK